MKKYNVIVDDVAHELSIESLLGLDLVATDADTYHAIDGQKGYDIVLVSQQGKQISLKINGNIHHIDIRDEYDLLVDKMGLSNTNNQKLSSVKSPMPGLILDITVAVGQEIEDGDSLLILEAMKMENVLKSTGSGVIKSIEVSKGDTVEKNQILIEME